MCRVWSTPKQYGMLITVIDLCTDTWIYYDTILCCCQLVTDNIMYSRLLVDDTLLCNCQPVNTILSVHQLMALYDATVN